MKSQELRQVFFEFFRSKGHEIVPSAPMVIKDDPPHVTNAGMNQFKDIFLVLSSLKISGSQTHKNVSEFPANIMILRR